MLELSNERIEQILNEETMKTVELATLLRSIYLRYMRLFEGYFADIDALNDTKIAQFRKYHEETCSLVRYALSCSIWMSLAESVKHVPPGQLFLQIPPTVSSIDAVLTRCLPYPPIRSKAL